MLIVDARPLLDYANSRVSARHSVNIPDQVITPGLSANALGKRIPAEFQDKWEERDNFAALILMDWRTTSSTIEGTKIAIVRSAIIDVSLFIFKSYFKPLFSIVCCTYYLTFLISLEFLI